MNSWESAVKLFGNEGALRNKQFGDTLDTITGNPTLQGLLSQHGQLGQQVQQGQQRQAYIPPEVPAPSLPPTPMQFREAFLAHIAHKRVPTRTRPNLQYKPIVLDSVRRNANMPSSVGSLTNINELLQIWKSHGIGTGENPMLAIVQNMRR